MDPEEEEVQKLSVFMRSLQVEVQRRIADEVVKHVSVPIEQAGPLARDLLGGLGVVLTATATALGFDPSTKRALDLAHEHFQIARGAYEDYVKEREVRRQ